MKHSLLLSSLLALAVASPAALAHQQGDIIVRAGATMVDPDIGSSSVKLPGGKVPGSDVNVNDDTQLGLTLGYMLTDHVGIELLAATPFEHSVTLSGLGGGLDGKLADIKQLPPTISLQWFPMAASSKWQPYVGAGINYTYFFDEELTSARKAVGWHSLDREDSWGLALQVGMDYMITDRVLLNAAVWRIDIDSEATAYLGNTKAKVDIEVDPWVYMIGIGYKF